MRTVIGQLEDIHMQSCNHAAMQYFQPPQNHNTPFPHSPWLEYAGWLAGNSLLSTIRRDFETSN